MSRGFLQSARAYSWSPGLIAWAVHRTSGVLLVLYLCLHLAVLSRLSNPAAYASVVRLAAHPLVQALEFGLLGLLAAHGLNGLRVTLLEFGLPTRLHRPMLTTVAVLWVCLMAATCVYALGGFV